MKKYLALLTMAATVMMYSCGEDEEMFAAPSVSGPSSSSLQVGTSADLSFTFDAEAGFASATVSAENGTATISTDGEAGATSGTITVAFTAGTSAGAASATLTVTDSEGEMDEATAVLNVTAEPVAPTVDVFASEEGTGTTTWTADNVYVLRGFVFVNDGDVLTIEPGTVIKGQPGEGAGASALIVARGGQIIANGTASAPIVFTSLTDELSPADIAAGNFGSPNLDPTTAGTWGGLIVLGGASISAQNSDDADVSEVQIEGIPSSEQRGLYGGSDDADNSGSMQYISVRHGGSLIGAGNEINGITLGGVGSGTTIENVEVVGNADDGIEWFGGNVNVTNALVWNAGDDALDTDQDWIGTCDNFVVVTPRGGSAFELDGPEGTLNRGFHTFINGTVFAGADIDHLVDWDGSTNAIVDKVYFTGFDAGYPATDFVPVESFGGSVPAADAAAWTWEATMNGQTIAAVFGDAAGITTEVTAPTNAGADASVFGWTWASQSGALAEAGIE